MTKYGMPWQWKVPEGGIIGTRGHLHQDGYPKVAGTGIFAHDIYFPGMLYAKPLESKHAHAKIKRMDTSAAEALPGVIKIIRYDDPDITFPTWHGYLFPPGRYNGYKLLQEEALFPHQVVGAIVIAESELVCDEALRLIDNSIEWEQMLVYQHLGDEALQPGADILFPDRSPDTNLQMQLIEQYGDIEAGLTESPNVIDVEITHEPDVWAGVEGGCCVAWCKGEDNKVEVWNHCQHPMSLQGTPEGGSGDLKQIVQTGNLGLKLSSFAPVYHLVYNGGTFGGGYCWVDKQTAYWAILASQITKKPVKFIWDGGGAWHGVGEELGTYRMKIGFKDNGEVTAVKYHTLHNMSVMDHLIKIRKASKIENLYADKQYIFQNYGQLACYKHGAGSSLCQNEVFEQVASTLGMDPTEVAVLNDGSYGRSMDWINENFKENHGFDKNRNSLKEILEVGKKAIDWENKWHLPGKKILPNGNYHGIGFVWNIAWEHIGDQGYEYQNEPYLPSVLLRLNSDGTVTISGQRTDTGQLTETSFRMAVASELGIKYEDVFYANKEYTGVYLFNPGGSMGSVRNLVRIVTAAKNLKQKILEVALRPIMGGYAFPSGPTPFEGMSIEDLDIKDGYVYEKANPNNKAAVEKFSAHQPIAWNYDQPTVMLDDAYCMVRQCYFLEVEVDPDTGKVYNKNIVHVYDCGRCMSPDSMEGQLYGGLYMGIGRSGQEQVIYDPITGTHLNDDHIGYPIALINDVEELPDTNFIETGLAYGAYGLCGCSESQAANAAIITRYAVHNAIGKWIDYKTTPEKILKALGKI